MDQLNSHTKLTITVQICDCLCIRSCKKRGDRTYLSCIDRKGDTEKRTRVAEELVRGGYKLIVTYWDMRQSCISEFGSPSRTENLTLLEHMILIV